MGVTLNTVDEAELRSHGLCPFLNDRQDLFDDRECSIGLMKLARYLLRLQHDRCGHVLQGL
jgi:hypothetical protein